MPEDEVFRLPVVTHPALPPDAVYLVPSGNVDKLLEALDRMATKPALHVRHPSDGPVVHDGPGHRYADPSWCGGCWWEMVGQYRPPMGAWDRHADDCPGCAESAVTEPPEGHQSPLPSGT